MSDKIRVWDLPIRVFHWLLAGSFAAAYIVAESDRLRGIHLILGYTTMGLIAFRLVWGFVGPQFARFRSFLYGPRAAFDYLRSLRTDHPQRFIGHNPAGSYAIYAILIVGLATGVTGYLTLNKIGGESLEDLHEVCANVWLGVVIVHIAGVVAGSVIHRENLVRAMITGYKRGADGETVGGVTGASAGRAMGIALALGVATFWVWGLLTGSLDTSRGERDARQTGPGQELRAERGDRDD